MVNFYLNKKNIISIVLSLSIISISCNNDTPATSLDSDNAGETAVTKYTEEQVKNGIKNILSSQGGELDLDNDNIDDLKYYLSEGLENNYFDKNQQEVAKKLLTNLQTLQIRQSVNSEINVITNDFGANNATNNSTTTTRNTGDTSIIVDINNTSSASHAEDEVSKKLAENLPKVETILNNKKSKNEITEAEYSLIVETIYLLSARSASLKGEGIEESKKKLAAIKLQLEKYKLKEDRSKIIGEVTRIKELNKISTKYYARGEKEKSIENEKEKYKRSLKNKIKILDEKLAELSKSGKRIKELIEFQDNTKLQKIKFSEKAVNYYRKLRLKFTSNDIKRAEDEAYQKREEVQDALDEVDHMTNQIKIKQNRLSEIEKEIESLDETKEDDAKKIKSLNKEYEHLKNVIIEDDSFLKADAAVELSKRINKYKGCIEEVAMLYRDAYSIISKDIYDSEDKEEEIKQEIKKDIQDLIKLL